MDLGDAVLLPGLVNAHCHLDYTQLRGLLAPPRSFPDWIKSILAAKAAWSDDDFARSWKDGAAQLLRHGTTTVANIETQTTALASLRSFTPLRLHSFLELTGVRLRRPPATLVDEAESLLSSLPDHPGAVGLSPHAPYSTGPELLSEAAARARRRSRRHAHSRRASGPARGGRAVLGRQPRRRRLGARPPDGSDDSAQPHREARSGAPLHDAAHLADHCAHDELSVHRSFLRDRVVAR